LRSSIPFSHYNIPLKWRDPFGIESGFGLKGSGIVYWKSSYWKKILASTTFAIHVVFILISNREIKRKDSLMLSVSKITFMFCIFRNLNFKNECIVSHREVSTIINIIIVNMAWRECQQRKFKKNIFILDNIQCTVCALLLRDFQRTFMTSDTVTMTKHARCKI
jgi:hypothetical protein